MILFICILFLNKLNYLFGVGVWVIDLFCENKYGVLEILLFLYFEVSGVLNLLLFIVLEFWR